MRLKQLIPLATAVSATALMLLPTVAGAEPQADPDEMVVHTDASELTIATAGAQTAVTFTPGIPLGEGTRCFGPLVAEGTTADFASPLSGNTGEPGGSSEEDILDRYAVPVGGHAAIDELIDLYLEGHPNGVPESALATLRAIYTGWYLYTAEVGTDLGVAPAGTDLDGAKVSDILTRGGMVYGPTSNTFTYELDANKKYVAISRCLIGDEQVAYLKDIGTGTGTGAGSGSAEFFKGLDLFGSLGG